MSAATQAAPEVERLQRELATANRRIAELESAYLEQVELTVRMRDTRCPHCIERDALRERFELESA